MGQTHVDCPIKYRGLGHFYTGPYILELTRETSSRKNSLQEVKQVLRVIEISVLPITH